LAETKAGPAEAFAELGEGWTGDEALAIALYAAMRHASDFFAALVLAVNHSGDSDSTGSICGAILGVACGAQAIPERLLINLERRDDLEQLARAIAQTLP
jgi:ADP-ribosylglycohydrolase